MDNGINYGNFTMVLKTELISNNSALTEKNITIEIDKDMAHAFTQKSEEEANLNTEYFYDFSNHTIYLKAGDQWIEGNEEFGLKLPIDLQYINHFYDLLKATYPIEATADGYQLITTTLADSQIILDYLNLEKITSGTIGNAQITLLFNGNQQLVEGTITLTTPINETKYLFNIDYNESPKLTRPEL